MSESSGQVRVYRASKCNVSIKEIDLYGRFITLFNSSKTKGADLSNWTLERDHPKGLSSYKFDNNYVLGPEKEVKVFAGDYAEDAGAGDLKAQKSMCKIWGHGNGKVILKDDGNLEKANSTITYS